MRLTEQQPHGRQHIPFIYLSFNDVVTSSDYTVSNITMNNEWLIWKYICEVAEWSKLKYSSNMFVEGAKKTTKNVSKHNQYSGKDLYAVFLEYWRYVY
jgi:hypothetical protein